MKITIGKTIAALIMVIMLVCVISGGSLAEGIADYDAYSMRLLRYEGEVEIRDANGEPRFVLENVRFSSGETMCTGEESLASISLDDTKIVTMDQLSKVLFEQEDNHFILTLQDGSILLDVSKKLDENEELDIQTSNMTVGIRGTIISLTDIALDELSTSTHSTGIQSDGDSTGSTSEKPSEIPSVNATGIKDPADADLSRFSTDDSEGMQMKEVLNEEVIGLVHDRVSVLCVLEGKAQVTYRNKEGELKTKEVRAGEKAVLTDRQDFPEEALQTRELFREDLQEFVLKRLDEESTLRNRVEGASDVLEKLNPVYQEEIVFTAESVRKSFDGTDSATGAVFADGLPEGFTYTAASEGHQTEVGSSASSVAEYAIYDEFGINATERFRNIQTVDGLLTTTWDEPVTLIAQSASKMYDGEALERPADVLVNGLPEGYSIRVFAKGSQTDVGTAINSVGEFTIQNPEGDDVTTCFTKVEKISGKLVVDPAPLTVWTGSAEKIYDGRELINPEAKITSARDYNASVASWRNLSYVLSDIGETGDDCQTLYCVCGVVWVHGTNPLTEETREIKLFAGQKLTVFLHDDQNVQTIEFKKENIKPEDLPERILRLFQHNPALLTRACNDCGWNAESVKAIVDQLPEETDEAKLVRKHGILVEESEADQLMKDFTNVRITIDTDITDYTDRALGHNEAKYTPVTINESIQIKATGSQTEVGRSQNTYEIKWGRAKKGNYVLKEELGILTVLKPEDADAQVTLTAASAEKTYDGKPLEDSSVTVTGLPSGYTVTATATGSQKDAGTSANTVTKYQILDMNSADVTGVFDNVKLVAGTLTVTPAKATVTTRSASKVYDGTALSSPEASIEGLVEGETATVTATGSITEPGETANTYTVDWGSTNPANYTLNNVSGTLTVETLKLAVDLGSVSADYNGFVNAPKPTITYANGEHAGEAVMGTRARIMRLMAGMTVPKGLPGEHGMLFRFVLFTGDQAEMSITGMGSGAGIYNLEASVRFSGDAEGRYTIDSVSGTTMTVNPAKLIIKTGSASKVYDGQALTNPEATVTGFAEGEVVTVTATGSITDADEQDNTYTIDWGDTDPSNYTVVEDLGKLKIEPLGIRINMDACEQAFYDYFTEEYPAYYEGTPYSYYYRSDEYDGAFAEYTNGLESGTVLTPSSIATAYSDDEEYDIASETATYVLPGGKATVEMPAFTDAGSYQMVPAIAITAGEQKNYVFTWTDNEMVIEPMPIIIDMKGGYSTSFTNLTHLPRGVTATYNGWSEVNRTRSQRMYREDKYYYIAEFDLIGTDHIELTSTGPRTVGKSKFDNTIQFTSGKKDNYDIIFQNDEIEITPLYVNLYLTEYYYYYYYSVPAYDGEFHGADPFVGGYSSWLTCEKNDEGTWDFTGSIRNKVLFNLAVEGGGTDAGEYKLTPTITYPTVPAENFDIHIYNDTVYIDPAPLTITTGSAEKPYDGKALTNKEMTVEGLVDGETLSYRTTGSQTEFGSSENTFTLVWDGTAKEDNYVIYEDDVDLGILEVTHAYQAPVYDWSDDLKSVTATLECIDTPSATITETVTTTETMNTAATCKTGGQSTYTATFTNDVFTTQEKTGATPVNPDNHVWVQEQHGPFANISYRGDGSYYDAELHAGPEYVRTCSMCGEQGTDGATVPFYPKLITTTVALTDLLIPDAATLSDCESGLNLALGTAAISLDRMYYQETEHDEESGTETYTYRPLNLPAEDLEIFVTYSWAEDVSGISISDLTAMFEANPKATYRAKVNIEASPYRGTRWYGRSGFAMGSLDLYGDPDQFGISEGEIEIIGHVHDWQDTGFTDPYAEERDGAWCAVPGTKVETCSICSQERIAIIPIRPDMISLKDDYRDDSYDDYVIESPYVSLQEIMEHGYTTLSELRPEEYLSATVTLPEADHPDKTHTIPIPGRFVFSDPDDDIPIEYLNEWITDVYELSFRFIPTDLQTFEQAWCSIILENDITASIPQLYSDSGDVEVSGFNDGIPHHTVMARIWKLTDTGKATLADIDLGSALSLRAIDTKGNAVPGTFSWTANMSGVATADACTAQPDSGWTFTFTPDDLINYQATTAVLKVEAPYNTYMRRSAVLRGFDERAMDPDPSISYAGFVDIQWLEYVAGRYGWTYMSEIVPETIGFEWFYADSFSISDLEYGHNTVSGISSWDGIVGSYGSAASLSGISGSTTIASVAEQIKTGGEVVCCFHFTPNDSHRYGSGTAYLNFTTKWPASWEKYDVIWKMDEEILLTESLYKNSRLIPPERVDVCCWTLDGEVLTGADLMPDHAITIIGVAHDWGEEETVTDEHGTTVTKVCKRDPSHVNMTTFRGIIPTSEPNGQGDDVLTEGIETLASETVIEEPLDFAPAVISEEDISESTDGFTGSVRVEVQNEGEIYEGDMIHFLAVVQGDASLVTICWQMKAEDPDTQQVEWEDIATGKKCSIEASTDHLAAKYRVVLLDADNSVVAEAEVRFPEMLQKETEAPETDLKPTDDGEDSGTEIPEEPADKSEPDPEVDNPEEIPGSETVSTGESAAGSDQDASTLNMTMSEPADEEEISDLEAVIAEKEPSESTTSESEPTTTETTSAGKAPETSEPADVEEKPTATETTAAGKAPETSEPADVKEERKEMESAVTEEEPKTADPQAAEIEPEEPSSEAPGEET